MSDIDNKIEAAREAVDTAEMDLDEINECGDLEQRLDATNRLVAARAELDAVLEKDAGDLKGVPFAPCPFCDSFAAVMTWRDRSTVRAYSVLCGVAVCGGRGPEKTTRAEAFDAWQRWCATSAPPNPAGGPDHPLEAIQDIIGPDGAGPAPDFEFRTLYAAQEEIERLRARVDDLLGVNTEETEKRQAAHRHADAAEAAIEAVARWIVDRSERRGGK